MMALARTWRLLRDLQASVRTSPEALAALQARLLYASLEHTYQKVPHYRRVWDELGLRPSGPEDLALLPVTTREAVRDGLASGDILARGATQTGSFPSSGTSGEPLQVPRGPDEQRLWRTLALRTWLEHGHRPWHVVAHLDATPALSHALARLGLGRTTWISTELPTEDQLTALERACADIWVGTPTVLARIADAVDGSVARPPRLVVSQGEVLDAGTRRLIRRTLGPDPIDVYGSTEVGYMAWQCEQRRGLHMNADAFLIEVLRDGRPAAPGEVGAVVVTSLRSRTMPLIRYDTGDLATATEDACECGRTLPLLSSTEGRAADALLLEDGRVLTPRTVVDHMGALLPPTRYVVRQKSSTRFVLYLDPESGVMADPAVGHLSTLLGRDDVEVVIGLPTSSGDATKAHPVSRASSSFSGRGSAKLS